MLEAIEAILSYSVTIPWWALALLCAGCSSLGFLGLALCWAARRGDEYGPSLEEADHLRMTTRHRFKARGSE